MDINVWIVKRTDGTISTFSTSSSWEINRDYLTNEKSTFALNDSYNAEKGDFILAKAERHDVVSGFYDTSSNIPILFLGVIDAFDGDNIIACDIYNLVNFDFAATKKTGTSFEGHIYTLLQYYFLNDTSKIPAIIQISRDAAINTAHSYQPQNNPTSTNLVDYLINGFKKYNTVWEVSNLTYSKPNKLTIETEIRTKTRSIRLKNNAYDFADWDVYVTPVGRDLENKLLIVPAGMNNSEIPTVLSTWYLTMNGELTQSINESVYLPTKTKVNVFDTTQDNKPSYLEVAQSELAGNNYAHEISFNIKLDNTLLPIQELEIGLLGEIVYGNTIFRSVLTGYRFSSGDKYMYLKWGHVRSTLSEILP
ncbi:hypothetical protein HB837_15770 [Listeria innocua]|uniref:hypothetical protein n=1 Tax=Listeria innocua TaxID=1642 RepID=UPI0016260244|nr:hypothetical protein [Listeria innocua]MBC1353864.1 hypothetical protein [Listeria innocua]